MNNIEMTKTETNLNKLRNFFSNKKITYEKIIDISSNSSFADYFYIVSVDNMRMVDSLKIEIIDFCEQNDIPIRNKDNVSSPWVLIDLNDIILHLFTEETRQYYNLERLWADGKIVL